MTTDLTSDPPFAEQPPFVLAGPSHVVHLKRAVSLGEAASPRRPVRWLGARAVSLFHPLFAEEEFVRKPMDALLLIPDFRIGNRAFGDPDHPAWHSGIDKRFFTPEIDAQMYRKTLDTVLGIRDANPRCRFMFWSLAGREHTNRQQGRHQENGIYRHPVWNLDEAEAELGDSVVSLQPLLKHPLVRTMYKDSQLHPTRFGYEFLRRVMDDLSFGVDVDVRGHLDEMQRTMTVPVIDFPRPTVLTGASGWIQTVEHYRDMGLVRLGDNVEFMTDFAKIGPRRDTEKELVWISKINKTSLEDDGAGFDREIGVIREMVRRGYKPRVLVWESHAYAIQRTDHRFPAKDPRNADSLDRALRDELGTNVKVIRNQPGPPRVIEDRDVELDTAVRGPMPTSIGLDTVLNAVGGRLTRAMFDRALREGPTSDSPSSVPATRGVLSRISTSSQSRRKYRSRRFLSRRRA